MNKCFFVGRLTKDVDIKQTSDGSSFARFSIAVQRTFKNANGDREADFPCIVAFKQKADFVSKYFSKGSPICVECSFRTGKYEKDGETKYTNEFIADNIEFVPKDSSSEHEKSSEEGPIPW